MQFVVRSAAENYITVAINRKRTCKCFPRNIAVRKKKKITELIRTYRKDIQIVSVRAFRDAFHSSRDAIRAIVCKIPERGRSRRGCRVLG